MYTVNSGFSMESNEYTASVTDNMSEEGGKQASDSVDPDKMDAEATDCEYSCNNVNTKTDSTNASLSADIRDDHIYSEAQLLGSGPAVDLLIDDMDESLLNTPSKGIPLPTMYEPMQVDLNHESDEQRPSTESAPEVPTTKNDSVNTQPLGGPADLPTPESQSHNDKPRLTEAETFALRAKLNNLLLQTRNILSADNTTSVHSEIESQKLPSKQDAVLFIDNQRLTNQQVEQLQSEPRVRLRQIRPTGHLSRPVREIPREGTSDDRERHEKLIYISDRTRRWIADNIGTCINSDDWRCKVCQWSGPKRRVQIHVKQHVVQMYCKCSHNRISRDMVYDHQVSMHRAGLPDSMAMDPDQDISSKWTTPPIMNGPET